MGTTSYHAIWPELQKRGLIRAERPERLDGGNRDRADKSKEVFRVRLPDGSAGKVTVGVDLHDLASRTRSWTQAFPSLGTVPLFQLRLGEFDVLGDKYFAGFTLGRAVAERLLPTVEIHRAFSRIITALESGGSPSTETDRQNEWKSWCNAIASLTCWSASDASFLQNLLFPALAPHLFVDPPKRRWVHGDLTDENILLNRAGDCLVIDPEFAHETHFFATEAARFHELSGCAVNQPGIFSAILPVPNTAWQIHFWITQIQREIALNTADFVAQWLPSRLAFIRRDVDRLFGASIACPWPPPQAETRSPSETAQLFWRGSDTGSWTEATSQRLMYHHDSAQHVIFPVHDRAVPWRLDPASGKTTLIHYIALYSERHELIRSFGGQELTSPFVSVLHDTTCDPLAAGLCVHSVSGDPQLSLPLGSEAELQKPAWLEVVLCSNRGRRRLEAADSTVEESRWVDLAPATFRVAGWFHSPDYTPVQQFFASIQGEIVALSEARPRPDVQRHFAGAPESQRSGFQLDVPATAAGHLINLGLRLSSGEEFFFHSLLVPCAPKRAVLAKDYSVWVAQHDPDPAPPSAKVESDLTFSILLPVYNSNPRYLEECLTSVRKQYYLNWELCLVDDASTASSESLLDDVSRSDPRIRIRRRASNGGIARATNDALAMATGEYVVLLDHDDVLRPHALAEMASRLHEQPDLDAVYSDEDKIDANGVRIFPLLKPDLSPEFLCGVMYVGHLLCVRTSAARAIGGFDPAFDGIQDYEFFLRLTERTSRIGHLPRILYHWRMSPESSAMIGNVKGDMDKLQLIAVRNHLARTSRHASAVAMGGHRVRLLPLAPFQPSQCTAILLDGMGAEWLRGVASFVAPSRDPAGIIASATAATTPFVLIITAKLKAPRQPDWLDHLLMLAAEKDAGAVGPVLLEDERTVASAGVLLNPDGELVPLMRGFAHDGEGYNGSLLCTREVMTLSPECIAIRRELLTGDPHVAQFASIDDWAVDLCLSLQERGKRNLVCASVHSERSPAREPEAPTSRDRALSLKKWQHVFHGADRYYPAWCDRRTGDYRLRTDLLSGDKTGTVLRWFIDVPTNFTLPAGYLRMRGWCYSTSAKILQVRLVLPDRELFGRYGTPRPDVPKVHPEVLDTNSGFELWAIIPAGEHQASLQFQDDSGAWQTATSIKVQSVRSRRPMWLPGSSTQDLVHFQLGARPSHAPRKVGIERFPSAKNARENYPRFAIVTPSFNQARFLGETLSSVLNQSEVDLQYIVQDGGSTDTSIDVIRQHSARITQWESTRDHGQADAIARAFAKTTGRPEDIMAWLNSDDVYLPGALAFVADYFARHPRVDAIYGHRILIDDNSDEVGRWFLPRHDEEVLRLNDYVPQETLFWRRRLWDRVGGINSSFKFAMDWDLLLRFSDVGAKIVRLPYFLACFRIHAVQKTSSQIDGLGSQEIGALREASQGRALSPTEVENDPRLLSFLRKSAWIEFLWRRFGIRHP